MKKMIIPIICILSVLMVLLNINVISDALANVLTQDNNTKIKISNDYYKDSDYAYISNAKNFTPYGKQDILNIIYTMINNGVKNFTFYCPSEYTDCTKDVNDFTKDDNLLTHINNFVHPFNSIAKITTTVSDSGEINFEAQYLYNEEQIKKIDEEVDRILNEITKDLTDEENSDIKAVHDYIINNTSYDLDNNKENQSYIAYGALFNHLATCNGYTDLMAIFLSKMGYDNFKVATTGDDANQSGHVWNAVKINDNWLHLDLTWDDPVSKDGKNHLYHKYFLLTTEQLITADKDITSKEHDFNKAIYLELKNTSEN